MKKQQWMARYFGEDCVSLQQRRAYDLFLQGNKKSDIAKIMGLSRGYTYILIKRAALRIHQDIRKEGIMIDMSSAYEGKFFDINKNDALYLIDILKSFSAL